MIEGSANVLLTLVGKYRGQWSFLHILPKMQQMPGERLRIIKKEPIGIMPGLVYLARFEAHCLQITQVLVQAGKVSFPRLRILSESLAAVMSASGNDDRQPAHGHFQAYSCGVDQAEVGEGDQIIGIDRVLRGHNV